MRKDIALRETSSVVAEFANRILLFFLISVLCNLFKKGNISMRYLI